MDRFSLEKLTVDKLAEYEHLEDIFDDLTPDSQDDLLKYLLKRQLV